MKNFISEVLSDVKSSGKDFSNTTFVFPNKRAGRYLLYQLGNTLNHPIFSPIVCSIGEFMEEVSGLMSLDKNQSIFRFYETYTEMTPEKEQENFEKVYSWAQTLMTDFNEIDQYLIESSSFFDYLSNIKELEHWSKGPDKTELVENYLAFWQKLPQYHHFFVQKLLSKKEAYPGLQYRQAAEKINNYITDSNRYFVFVGFNALNPAEQKIIQHILTLNRGEIYWDIDEVFLNNPNHAASLFFRDYQKNWERYATGEKAFKWVGNNYKNPKNIHIIGIPKSIGQAKKAGEILSGMTPEELEKTAVILGDQSLAPVMLNSLPGNVEKANLTMGLPLAQTPPASFFDQLFRIHSSGNKFYYKDVLTLLEHPLLSDLRSRKIIKTIRDKNLVFLTHHKIMEMSPENPEKEIFDLCFGGCENNPILFLQKLSELTKKLKQKTKDLQNEYLFHFHIFFNKLLSLMEKPVVESIRMLHQIYKNSIYSESLNLGGEPFEGVQLMGLLESRGMDFENIIITSLNEGILPLGKSGHSFIPYDLKKEKGLPTYKERDAIYTYYFYRLLQRAKNVFLLYDCIPGSLNSGEKSRFLNQLKVEKQEKHVLKESILSQNIPSTHSKPREIPKTEKVMEKLKLLAQKGFSPSALTLYIKNPLAYYDRYVLGVKEAEKVEETVAANTLGTVIHDTLEKLYQKEKGTTYFLDEIKMKYMLESYQEEVISQFKEEYGETSLESGKNLIIVEVAKRYVHNFLKNEHTAIKNKNRIEILDLEREMRARVDIPERDFPIYLNGKADRIDNFNGMLRIIDYKTGKVENTELYVVEWDELSTEEKTAKAFQVLCYASLYHREKPFSECEAGVISFKSLNDGFLKFDVRPSSKSSKKDTAINVDILSEFEKQLKKIILEITDPEVPFVEKLEAYS